MTVYQSFSFALLLLLLICDILYVIGRGGNESSKIPKLIEALFDVKIIRVFCGSQFSVALTVDGAVYTWGKGEHYRLGHGTEDILRYPKKIIHFKSN